MRVFVGFWDWYDVGGFPDGGDGVFVQCEVEDVCEVGDCDWSQVFEMSDVNVVVSERVVCLAVFDGVCRLLRLKRDERGR